MRLTMLLLVSATSALSLSACRTVVQNRVEMALVDAGVPAGMAGCKHGHPRLQHLFYSAFSEAVLTIDAAAPG